MIKSSIYHLKMKLFIIILLLTVIASPNSPTFSFLQSLEGSTTLLDFGIDLTYQYLVSISSDTIIRIYENNSTHYLLKQSIPSRSNMRFI